MITAKLLEEEGACAPQLARFRELFGDCPAPLTVTAALAVANDFDWGWAANALLKTHAWRAYIETATAAEIAYREAVRVRYSEKAVTVAGTPCRETTAELGDDDGAARGAYNETVARRFAELYIEQETKS